MLIEVANTGIFTFRWRTSHPHYQIIGASTTSADPWCLKVDCWTTGKRSDPHSSRLTQFLRCLIHPSWHGDNLHLSSGRSCTDVLPALTACGAVCAAVLLGFDLVREMKWKCSARNTNSHLEFISEDNSGPSPLPFSAHDGSLPGAARSDFFLAQCRLPCMGYTATSCWVRENLLASI